jgi:hypothetical protein
MTVDRCCLRPSLVGDLLLWWLLSQLRSPLRAQLIPLAELRFSFGAAFLVRHTGIVSQHTSLRLAKRRG